MSAGDDAMHEKVDIGTKKGVTLADVRHNASVVSHWGDTPGAGVSVGLATALVYVIDRLKEEIDRRAADASSEAE